MIINSAIGVDPGDVEKRGWTEKLRHDPVAFDRLYDEYLPRVYSYIYYRIGSKQDSEDLVAETFLRAVRAFKNEQLREQHEHSFAAWLFRVAHNLVADYHSRNQKLGEWLALDELPGLQTEGLPLDEALVREEMFGYLHHFISTLSPRKQEIVTLKFFGGLRNTEIASVLGLEERTVSSHLCLAIEDLYQKFVASGIHEPGRFDSNSSKRGVKR